MNVEASEEGESKLTPYKSDLDYLETECKALFSLFQIAQVSQQKGERSAMSYGGEWNFIVDFNEIRPLFVHKPTRWRFISLKSISKTHLFSSLILCVAGYRQSMS